jgi:hypothetical protein
MKKTQTIRILSIILTMIIAAAAALPLCAPAYAKDTDVGATVVVNKTALGTAIEDAFAAYPWSAKDESLFTGEYLAFMVAFRGYRAVYNNPHVSQDEVDAAVSGLAGAVSSISLLAPPDYDDPSDEPEKPTTPAPITPAPTPTPAPDPTTDDSDRDGIPNINDPQSPDYYIPGGGGYDDDGNEILNKDDPGHPDFILPGGAGAGFGPRGVLREDGLYAVWGAFGTYSGHGQISARIDAPFDRFVRLNFGGSRVADANFIVREGSTIISLKESYAKTLSPGSYTFVAYFSDGYSRKISLKIPGTDTPGDGSGSGSGSGAGTGTVTPGGDSGGREDPAVVTPGKDPDASVKPGADPDGKGTPAKDPESTTKPTLPTALTVTIAVLALILLAGAAVVVFLKKRQTE